ncbi:hypothetical protein PR048_009997 [Dryococelus australis]|uniref:Uncharacterized protein n=1 Tax=Dryococelus australis TaxID=614101 RepID=A0ABQ9I1H8_9NEOP|nr:hypothetical protein PR048_009997 [Dryococelus australis]
MYVKQCKFCEKYPPRNKKHVYHSRDIPTLPYEHVSADILTFGGKNFLIITAAYSKWVDIVPLQGKNVEMHGDPQILVSDNIPFNSRDLSILQRIDLNFSSAAQDMRRAMTWQKTVCTLPNSFYAKVGKQILAIGRLCKNIITLPSSDWSFFISTINSRLVRTVYHCRWTNSNQGYRRVFMNEKKTRHWHNRTSNRKYIAFKSGQNIVERTSHDKFWKPGVILGKHKTPRSYLVHKYRGNIIRRTSKDLRTSYNHHAPVKNYSDLGTISGDINMRVEGDRDSSEKTTSTMQDAVERDTEILN